MSNHILIIAVVVAYLIGFAVGGCVFGHAVYKRQCQAAIEAGVAEYVVNPKTGETTFTYKTLKE